MQGGGWERVCQGPDALRITAPTHQDDCQRHGRHVEPRVHTSLPQQSKSRRWPSRCFNSMDSRRFISCLAVGRASGSKAQQAATRSAASWGHSAGTCTLRMCPRTGRKPVMISHSSTPAHTSMGSSAKQGHCSACAQLLPPPHQASVQGPANSPGCTTCTTTCGQLLLQVAPIPLTKRVQVDLQRAGRPQKHLWGNPCKCSNHPRQVS